MDEYAITGSGQLAEIYEPPIRQAVVKQIDRLDEHCRALIGSSPFVTLASSSADVEARLEEGNRTRLY